MPRRLGPLVLHFADFPASAAAAAARSPPILLCHGMLGSSANWASVARTLERNTGRRVIAVDARNHGKSPWASTMSYPEMAADLSHTMATVLRAERVVLVGHSMGGRTAMALALLRPRLVDRLAVVDVSPVNRVAAASDDRGRGLAAMNMIFHAMARVRFPGGERLPAARRSADAQMARAGLADADLRAWLLTNAYEDAAASAEIRWRCNVADIQRAFASSLARFPEDLKDQSYRGPTLFIGGRLSDYLPVSDQPLIRRQFPTASFQYIAGAGHWVHAEKPIDFIKCLQTFIQESD